MQDNVLLILLGICGALLFSMLLGIFLYKQFRRLIGRFFIIGIVNKVIGDSKEDIEAEADSEPLEPIKHHSRAEIRAKAESLDFDAALEKYSAPKTPSATAQAADTRRSAPRLDTDADDHAAPPLRRHDDSVDDDLHDTR